MKMSCVVCNETLSGDEVRWGFDEPYCDDCFDHRYTHCTNCDSVISNDYARYNRNDEAFCDECFCEEDDPDCPDNPDVDEVDRVHIINLSRNWLKGEIENKRPIYINQKDYFLKTLREKIGLVEHPIYVFGLTDRDEYQISASPNLIVDVREFVLLNLPDIKVQEGFGVNRIGICYSLRKNNSKEVIGLIKSLTAVNEAVEA